MSNNTVPPQCLVDNPPQICLDDFASIRYLPSISGNATYLAIFAALLLGQAFLGIRYKTWSFLIIMLCGIVLEILGYGARIWEHSQPYASGPFTMYISALTIAPAFFTACIYLCLGRIIQVYGTQLSRFQPKTYTYLFCSLDFFCLVLQGAGGGIASTASTTSGINAGINTMIAGLALQVISLILFLILWADFTWAKRNSTRDANSKFFELTKNRTFKLFQWGLLVATVLILIRCIYRVAELSAGFKSALANNQTLFMILEGPMIFLALSAMTVLHPGIGFQGLWPQTSAFHAKRNAKREGKTEEGA